jgi:rod shape-determining protein MreD
MTKNVLWSVGFALIAALLQSTLLSRLTVFNATPDLALGILVFSAYVNGTMAGQVSGFFSGLFIDFLSQAPLGLNTLVRTLTGALSGLLRGTFYLDSVFLPMALCGGATVIKALLFLLLHFLFSGAIPAYSIYTPLFWSELLLNTLSAPFLFAFLKLFSTQLINRRVR